MAGEGAKLGGTTLLAFEAGRAYSGKAGATTLLLLPNAACSRMGGTTLLIPTGAPVTAANDDGPVAATIGGAFVQVNVLANDTGANLVVTSVTQPAQGSAEVSGGGAHVSYTPPGTGTPATLTFDYDVSGDNGTDTGTVTIDLADAPPPPSGPIGRRRSGLSVGELRLRL